MLEVISCRDLVARRACNHPRVIKEAGVARAKPGRLFDGRLRFPDFARLEGGPRQGVGPVDIAAHFILFPGARVCLVCFQVMIGMEESKLTVVKNAVEGAEPSDLFDERVLCRRILLAALEREKIAERSDERRVRETLNGALVLLDGACGVAARCERAAERGECAEIIWKGHE